MSKIIPVILCGGSGTRLWPLSRESYPKQFVKFGDNNTLFQDTLQRALRIDGCEDIVVVCNEDHRFYVTSELYQAQASAKIVLEPSPRNTAPAIALAAFLLAEQDDACMFVMPSDHRIVDEDQLISQISKAYDLAMNGNIVTFGIVPNRVETGFGYIEKGKKICELGFSVERFVEKPDEEAAKVMVKNGNYFWNSGMFLMKVSVYLKELEKFSPDIYNICKKAWDQHKVDGVFIRPNRDTFLSSPSDSIDYAVMEKTDICAMVTLSSKWSDLGSWEAFYQIGEKDKLGNVCLGDVLCKDTHNSYIQSNNKLLATIGLDNVLVVETADAVLVAKRDKSQDVKNFVTDLQKLGRREARVHNLVYRPWGSYETLSLGERFQVKRIVVNPGGELSLQMHHHRAEHWVVVSGTAEVTNEDKVQLFSENESTYIPIGAKHRLKNPGVIPLVLIEIQSGAYLGEDDIQRFADIYGREEHS